MLHSDPQNGLSKAQAEYNAPAPSGLPPDGQAGRQRETQSLSKQRKLTRNQERQRMEGLRVLARIIARHYLEHPEAYPVAADPDIEVDGNRRPGQKEE